MTAYLVLGSYDTNDAPCAMGISKHSGPGLFFLTNGATMFPTRSAAQHQINVSRRETAKKKNCILLNYRILRLVSA